MDLKGKRVLVTGGAVRIGAAMVEALVRHGAVVVVHYGRSRTEADALMKRLRSEGGTVFTAQADLRGEAACRALLDQACEQTGGLDGLVNNAAVFHKTDWASMDEAALLEELRINLFAPVALMRRFAERVEQGAVVNLLDRRVAFDDPTCVPYLLSKKGLETATRTAALAYAPRLRVNAVAPGPILPPPGKGDDYLHDYAGPMPLRRVITPGDVAEAVVFLLAQEAITGQTVFVDGGQHLHGDAG